MKYLILLFSLIIFSCHRNEDTTGITPSTAAVSQEETWKKALLQYPDSLPLVENLLAYYTNSQNYDAALAVVNSSIKRDSLNPELRDLQSVVFASKGDTTQAIKALEKAVEIYPMPAYIISLGALYAETKNPLALDMADALLVGTKSHAEKEAYFIKGLYYSYKNQKEKAISFFDRSLAADYQFMDAYLEKALALYDLKKYNDAVQVLTKAVTLQNNFDRGYYYLGQNLEKLNRNEDAQDAYEKALLYDPNYEEAKEALAKLRGAKK